MDEVVVEREGSSLVMKNKKGGDVYSVLVDGSFYTDRVWDYFNIGPVLAGNPENILVLGLGGGTVVRQYLGLFNASIDVVELNPTVVELAEKHFGIVKSERLNVILSDAFDYLESTGKEYDVIAVDLFEGDVIPEKFTTPEFMSLVSSRLRKAGIVVVNTITTGELFFTSSRMVENAARFFPTVFTLDASGNRLVIALNFKADRDYVIGKVDSFVNPLFEELKQKIKTRVVEHEA
ncbi:MAG: fused MFS/spermidine synthase [Candidatus Altiarchaeota archaeon]